MTLGSSFEAQGPAFRVTPWGSPPFILSWKGATNFLALRRLHLIGVTFRTRTIEERAEIARRFATDLLPALVDGRLKPVIDRVFLLQDALAAQEYMASNAQVGKIVLTV